MSVPPKKKPARRKKTPAAVPTHKNDPEPEDLRTGLKPREWSFAMHLVSTGRNLVESYVAAGYSGRDYADVLRLATDLASKERVKKAFAERVAANNDRYRNDAARVVEELNTLLYSSVRDYEVRDGRLELAPGADPRAWRAVRSVKHTVTENHRTGDVETKIQYELWSKEKAADIKARHHGLLVPDMPPLEVVLARLPAEISAKLRAILSVSDADRDALADAPPVVDEAMVELPVDSDSP